MQQNYAFIDAQNLNSGLSKLGWKIDWRRFREYLWQEKGVEVAYVFLGFMLGNQDLYLMLQRSGFVVVFKEILTTEAGEVKGNIDAEMVLQAMIDYDRYDQALIVSGDGDFTCLLRYLEQNNKLLGVLAPYEKGLSSLIQKLVGEKIIYLRSLRKQIEYRPVRDGRVKTQPKPQLQLQPALEPGRAQDVLPKQKTTPTPRLVGNPKSTQGPATQGHKNNKEPGGESKIQNRAHPKKDSRRTNVPRSREEGIQRGPRNMGS